MARKLDGNYITANTITTTQLQTTVVNQISAGGGPKVTTITYPNNQTATVNTGNESIVLTGTGFEANVQVYVNGSAVPSLSRINSTSLSFTTPALTTGTTYPLYVVNPDGGTAVVIPGMVVSAGPVWVTNSPLTSWGVSSALSTTLVANSDSSVSYALAAGSSLPSGLSLAANGLLSGTLTSPPASDTTYNFTVVATDLETQKSSKAFSITGTVGITATGGTVSNIAGYRVHTFTSSGSFVVTGSGTVEYLVVAGGGGGGTDAGGGGAGGYRTGSGFSVTPGTYSITVGGGGSGGSTGVNGSSSIFSTITSAGGGGSALAGGSGGGGGGGAGGAGNTPSTSPSQGNNGGTGLPAQNNQKYGGGGGAGAVGGDATPGQAGHGGSGSASSINGTSVTRAGGGGGGAYPANGGTGGSGGGGNGGAPGGSTSGSTNTGGGGGGGGCCGNPGSAGGSGIVIIRYAA